MLDIKEIMEIIPHRPPFLLIDRVAEIVEGKSIRAIKNVSMNEPYFVGHFPKEPVMPGVLQVEALAQAGAVAILSMEEYKGKTAYFAALKDVRFKNKVVPGDILTLDLEITKIRGSIGVGEGVVTNQNGEVCTTATLTFAIG